jgi:hypothetical protein
MEDIIVQRLDESGMKLSGFWQISLPGCAISLCYELMIPSESRLGLNRVGFLDGITRAFCKTHSASSSGSYKIDSRQISLFDSM